LFSPKRLTKSSITAVSFLTNRKSHSSVRETISPNKTRSSAIYGTPDKFIAVFTLSADICERANATVLLF
jgi:hypothetical protein